MNRLILLGNGFDLAHGMKTSYNDFILDYMIKCLTEVQENKTFGDEALEVTTNNYYYILESLGWDSLEAFVMDIYHTYGLKGLFDTETFFIGTRSIKNIYVFNFKYPFIKHLLENCSLNTWVEIENEYYSELKSILSNKSTNKKEELIVLNKSLAFLIKLLENYLSDLPEPEYHPDYRNILSSVFDKPIADVYKPLAYMQPEHTMILNFNYTSTVIPYLRDIEIHTEVNYIHGKLNDLQQPIIFGFGDEIDKTYQQIEDDQNNHFFTYIKSFWYFLNSNYHDLIRFIESEKYEVFILGHSCGLPDRTMLNMVFEHENCRSIKIFYYQNEKEHTNFIELTQEISRHFTNKATMRKKIVPFPLLSPMPQVKP
ncbi:AbiH family protein [Pedobacter gandavensis]|uniref:AbiH family protein n=1 Tax=Pedobacter gandavensis TaxID=2679963 RepID=UPI00292FE70D|nr:AbiH family protein [Pedobacter gandavensis]